MTYWTIMIVVILTGPLAGESTYLPYETEGSCDRALKVVSDTLDHDHTIVCRPTETPSGSIRPKRRPNHAN